jgi:hypothetical protein
MAGFGLHARWFEFTSDSFDHTSELPQEYNAGNRFYGRDVAEFIATGLGASGFETSFFDEDWGWMARAWRPEGPRLEIAVYHDLEEESERTWQLTVRSLETDRRLGVIPRFREVEADPQAIGALEGVFREAGMPLEQRAPG